MENINICIVIPAYNEERRIGKTLEEYCKFFTEKKKNKEILDFKILIVINNTTDRTEYIIKSFQKRYKELSYLNFKQGGKGFAIREGFKHALTKNFELIGFVDGDLATSPSSFYDLVLNMKNNDGTIASRYVRGSVVIPSATFRRIVVSRIFNLLTRTLLFLPYKDTQCGAKLFKRGTLEKIIDKLNMSRWAFDVDLLYHTKKMGFRIKEIKTYWVDKEYSKINFWAAGPMMGLAIIRLRLLNSPLKSIVGTYDKIVNIINKKIKTTK